MEESGEARPGEDPEPHNSAPLPTSSSASSSSAHTSQSAASSPTPGPSHSPATTTKTPNPKIKCSVCQNYRIEPVVSPCGHVCCRTCLQKIIMTNGSCLVCNQAIHSERSSCDEHSPQFPTSDSLLRMLSVGHIGNENNLDRYLYVLQRRREVMAGESRAYTLQLMDEFLSGILKRKTPIAEQLRREISTINRDMRLLEKSSDVADVNRAMSFANQPDKLSVRLGRMQSHMDELCRLYFEMRNPHLNCDESRQLEPTVPKQKLFSSTEVSVGNEALMSFERTMSQLTEYDGFKKIAALTYNSDVAQGSSIVSCTDFDKDSEYFAICGVNKNIKIFEYGSVVLNEAGSKFPSAEFSCGATVSCVTWNKYHKNKLASSDYSGVVTLWDVEKRVEAQSFKEHEKRVWSVNWSSSDPRFFASGGDDKTFKLWSTEDHKSVISVEGGFNICCVRISPTDFRYLAVGMANKDIEYYDLRNPSTSLHSLQGHQKTVSYLNFESTNEILSASVDGSLKLWDLNCPSRCVRSYTGHVNETKFVGLASNGTYFAVGSEDNTVYVYHKLVSRPVFTFEFETVVSMLDKPGSDKGSDSDSEPCSDFVSSVAWKGKSDTLLAANSQGLVKILQLE